MRFAVGDYVKHISNGETMIILGTNIVEDYKIASYQVNIIRDQHSVPYYDEDHSLWIQLDNYRLLTELEKALL